MIDENDGDVLPMIEVICDSSRHVRGKVAQIATFDRDVMGWQRRGLRMKRLHRRADKLRAAGIKPDPVELLVPEMFGPLKCKLCGLQVNWPGDEILDEFLAQNKLRITLLELTRC